MPLDAANRAVVSLKGGFRVQTIKGTVRTLGQHRMHMRGHVYAFIKFDLEDGGDMMLEKVVVLNSVGSELEPGVEGTFHVIRNKHATSLIAFEGTNGRRGDDVTAFQKSIRNGKLGSAFFVALMCFLAFNLAGLILMRLFRDAPFFVWVLYYIVPPVLIFRFFLKRVPSETDIRAAIGEASRQSS